MKRINILYLLISITFFNSCKSIKNLSAKDNSAKPHKSTNNNNTVFLDNISVTPGEERSSQLNSSDKKTSIIRRTPVKNFDIENAPVVQFKYATMLDVPVEDLSNIPLFEDIEYWWGTKYCMGGSTATCTDCSAFTQNIIRDIYAINLPRTAEQQYKMSQHIASTDIREGDLVFFQTSGRTISHVGVYLTNNKFAHASVTSGVTISDLNDPYWKPKYRGAGRVSK
ncbi:hypothetical protein BH11BAC6_BH11BAC6_07030 [soil metagenome]